MKLKLAIYIAISIIVLLFILCKFDDSMGYRHEKVVNSTMRQV